MATRVRDITQSLRSIDGEAAVDIIHQLDANAAPNSFVTGPQVVRIAKPAAVHRVGVQGYFLVPDTFVDTSIFRFHVSYPVGIGSLQTAWRLSYTRFTSNGGLNAATTEVLTEVITSQAVSWRFVTLDFDQATDSNFSAVAGLPVSFRLERDGVAANPNDDTYPHHVFICGAAFVYNDA